MADHRTDPDSNQGTAPASATRRRLLTIGASAAAAAVAGALATASSGASSGDALLLGTGNDTGDDVTTLTGQVGPKSVVLQVENHFIGGPTSSIAADGPNGATALRGMSTSGPGVHATSETGTGVFGECGSPRFLSGDPTFQFGNGIGVLGRSGGGPGVKGVSVSSHGVSGESTSGPGVLGISTNKPGVAGESSSGPGVSAFSETGTGMVGRAPGETHPGVLAISGTKGSSDNGLALKVVGKAGFTTAGTAIARAHSRDIAVSNAMVTSRSHVTVTFTADPNEVQVSWVERNDGVGFVLHLTNKPHADLPFTYLIVEPQ